MDKAAACSARGPEFDPSFIQMFILLSSLRVLRDLAFHFTISRLQTIKKTYWLGISCIAA